MWFLETLAASAALHITHLVVAAALALARVGVTYFRRSAKYLEDCQMPNCAPWYRREDYERSRSIMDHGEKLPTVSLVTGNIYGADRAMSAE
jgi:hypothetical protein